MADNRYKKGTWQGNRKLNPNRIIPMPTNEKSEIIRLKRKIFQLKQEIERFEGMAKDLNQPVSPIVALNKVKLVKLESELLSQ